MAGMRPARLVRAGDLVRAPTELTARVLCSNPERQSAASASASTWHIEYYAEGHPTARMLVDPAFPVEVVGG